MGELSGDFIPFSAVADGFGARLARPGDAAATALVGVT
jgi:hypothetical protein